MTQASAPRPKPRIIVVDDDDDFVSLVRLIFPDSDFELLSAATGGAGLDTIRANAPDVVILDLMLPDMHGWDVYMRMQAEAETQKIPVIVLTAHGTRHDRNFSLQVAHVHDYLMKPCLPSQLRHSVQTALSGTAISDPATA